MSNERRALDVSISVLALLLFVCGCSTMHTDPAAQDMEASNDSDRCEWFMDQALGMSKRHG